MVEVVDSTGQVTAYVCPLCLTQVPVLLQEMTEVREERKLLVHEEPTDEHRD